MLLYNIMSIRNIALPITHCVNNSEIGYNICHIGLHASVETTFRSFQVSTVYCIINKLYKMCYLYLYYFLNKQWQYNDPLVFKRRDKCICARAGLPCIAMYIAMCIVDILHIM